MRSEVTKCVKRQETDGRDKGDKGSRREGTENARAAEGLGRDRADGRLLPVAKAARSLPRGSARPTGPRGPPDANRGEARNSSTLHEKRRQVLPTVA